MAQCTSLLPKGADAVVPSKRMQCCRLFLNEADGAVFKAAAADEDAADVVESTHQCTILRDSVLARVAAACARINNPSALSH